MNKVQNGRPAAQNLRCTVQLLKTPVISYKYQRRSGNKAALIERVNDYIRSGSAKRLVDPDSAIMIMQRRIQGGG